MWLRLYADIRMASPFGVCVFLSDTGLQLLMLSSCLPSNVLYSFGGASPDVCPRHDYRESSDPDAMQVGMEKTLEHVENAFREHGPFDGVMGFSQVSSFLVDAE